MDELIGFWADVVGLGKETKDLPAGEITVRAAVIYAAALLLVRLGDKRLMGRSSPFDVVIAIMLGSVFSRAINGSAPFLGTLAAGAVLVFLHWLIAAVSYRSYAFSRLVKGRRRVLVRDGQLLRDQMAMSRVSEDDLLESLRLHGRVASADRVVLASLERNGRTSVVLAKREPRVVEVKVEAGVQTVRLELGW